jgi:hypothetical protein
VKNVPAPPGCLRYPEAAAHVGCCLRKFKSLVARGAVPHYRPSPRNVFFKITDLDTFKENSRRRGRGFTGPGRR